MPLFSTTTSNDIKMEIAQKLVDVGSKQPKRTYGMGMPSPVELDKMDQKSRFVRLPDIVGICIVIELIYLVSDSSRINIRSFSDVF